MDTFAKRANLYFIAIVELVLENIIISIGLLIIIMNLN